MPTLNQRGAVQFIILLILIAGIAGVVYLVTKGPLKILPKASEVKQVVPTTSFSFYSIKPGVNVGEEIAVQVLVHSDITAANLFDAKINYDPQSLRLGRVDVTSPFIKNWVEQYWGDPGKVSLVGGVPNPGFLSRVGDTAPMATLYFTALKAGPTTISFDDTSAIYSDADNTNVLVSKNPITLSIKSMSPAIPEKSLSYNLGAGWNAIGISVSVDDSFTPSQLLEATSGKCTDIQGFNPATGQAEFYTSDPAKKILNSVTKIVSGKGYLVKCSSSATLTLVGAAFVTTMPQLVASNVQYVSLPNGKSMTAQEFLEAVSTTTLDCSKVYRWFADGWDLHKKNAPALNNFQMNDKEGYNVLCTAVISSPAPTPAVTPQPGTGDGNNDGRVNLIDLSILLSDFNKNNGFRTGVDLNGDGKINSFDFSLMRNLLIEKKVIRG